jgi:hypothetical protein
MSEVTLILPDIHHRVDQATRIIEHVGADKVICLGDYFDDFGDDPETVTHTCEWLLNFADDPNHIMLVGNHDVHYAFDGDHWRCSGYEQWKHFLIHDILDGTKTWEKLKYYHILDNKFLLTHAGLDKHNCPGIITDIHNNRPAFLNAIVEFLDESIIQGHRQKGWAFNAGYSRRGLQPYGGLIWCDFNHEFFPIIGLNQIFGHTAQVSAAGWFEFGVSEKLRRYTSREIQPELSRFDDVTKSSNLCLDVHGNTHWAVWDGKSLEISNYKNDL